MCEVTLHGLFQGGRSESGYCKSYSPFRCSTSVDRFQGGRSESGYCKAATHGYQVGSVGGFRGDDPSQDTASGKTPMNSGNTPRFRGDDPSQDTASLSRKMCERNSICSFRGDDPSQDTASLQGVRSPNFRRVVSGGTIRVRILQGSCDF